MRSGPIPYAHRELPPMRARPASASGVYDSSPGSAGGNSRGAHTGKICQPGDGREHRAANPPVAGIAQHDAEPAAVALEGLAVLFVADRERADDAIARDTGEDLGSPKRRLEPVFYTGVRRGSVARRSVHPGIAAISASAGLGTMAVHPEAPASYQR